eukprot:CAMPEP_0168188138 /NCGR_PEP_ID=MMETSP0139_2-20121125/15465_1 /TAXON_ID=44445 /ORGANISM="Pseudo-nitzschia australis, Strain 10249 10 AB" /LENGTH=374 /DNA_ID=CAMNT_0008110511 /DNA_START=316 /DNA_END=1440 /DNA_ORIENTATION=+
MGAAVARSSKTLLVPWQSYPSLARSSTRVLSSTTTRTGARCRNSTSPRNSGLVGGTAGGVSVNANVSTAANKTTRASTFTTASAGASQTMQRTMPLFSKEAFRNALPIIGNGAYMALASGFLMTDMLQLRLMLVGGYAGLVGFHSLHAKPLQIPLRWSALFVLVNGGAAVLLFVDQWIGAMLSDEERALYEEHFKDGLTAGQFYYLIRMSSTQDIADDMVLTKEGQVSPYLYFIEKGQAKVYHNGTFAAYVDEGGFVNDVAFQQQQIEGHGEENTGEMRQSHSHAVGAYGTVVTHGDCKVRVWDQDNLKQYLEKRPEMDRNMKYTLSQHLVRSLLKQREVRRRLSESDHDDLEQIELTMPERKEFRRMRTSAWP